MAQRLLMRGRWWLACVLCFLALGVNAQGSVQPVPALTGHVMDGTGTLTAQQQAALESKLTTFEAASGTQLVVLIIATTAPEDITSYVNRVGNTWKIGRKEVGDGLLLVVAKDDRKLRIEVAKTLEGALPDLAAKQVIDQAISPRFKQGDFAGGIDAGVDLLIQLVKRENLPAANVQSPTQAVNPSAASRTYEADMKAAEEQFIWTLVALLVVFGLKVGPIAAVVLTGIYWFVGLATSNIGLHFNDTARTFYWSALIGPAILFLGFLALLAILPDKWLQHSANGKSRQTRRDDTYTSWGSSGSFGSSDSSSDSGSFSSGGGGDFGGGGASGDW